MFQASAENRLSITGYRQRLEARGYAGLRLTQQDYLLSHAAVVAPAIMGGLAFVFAGN